MSSILFLCLLKRTITYLFLKKIFIYFNWRLITLQCCGGFCHTSTWTSHGCTCGPPSWTPSLLPPHPLGCPRAPALSALLHGSNLHWSSSFAYGFNAILSNHPTLAFSLIIQKSVLYICVSFAVLHLGSSLPSFYVPFIYALIYCIGVSLREPFLNDSTDVHDLLLSFYVAWLLSFYALASDIRKFQIIPQLTLLTLNASEMFSLLTLLGEAKTFTRSACARASSLCSQSGQTCSVLDIFSPTEEDRSPKHFRLCAAAVLTFGLCVLQGCEAWRCESFLKSPERKRRMTRSF